jgi:hypothetical protein
VEAIHRGHHTEFGPKRSSDCIGYRGLAGAGRAHDPKYVTPPGLGHLPSQFNRLIDVHPLKLVRRTPLRIDDLAWAAVGLGATSPGPKASADREYFSNETLDNGDVDTARAEVCRHDLVGTIEASYSHHPAQLLGRSHSIGLG